MSDHIGRRYLVDSDERRIEMQSPEETLRQANASLRSQVYELEVELARARASSRGEKRND